MGKYFLVASYYDRTKKTFVNEKVIRVQGICLENLYEIDKFTSSKNYYSLWKRIKMDNDISDVDMLSIRYESGLDVKPLYYKVLVFNKIIFSCSNSLEKKFFSGRRRYGYGIRQDNEYYNIEKKELLNLVDAKDMDRLEEILYNNGYLLKLIKRYLNSYYDYSEQEAKYLDYNLIFEEFSKYETFRNWIVAKEKIKNINFNRYKDDGYVGKRNYGGNHSNSKPRFRSVDELYQYVDTKIKEEYGMSYEELLCYQYNTRNLDKEEFIEPDELEQMGYNDLEEIGNVKKLVP